MVRRTSMSSLDSRTSQLLDLVGLIYDAVPDRSRWPAFLDALAQATNCKRATLILDPGSTVWAVVCFHGWQDDEIRLFHERYASIDPWGTACLSVPEGEVRSSHELCSQEELDKNLAYREFYLPRDCVFGFGGMILKTA